jgi:hypothetical protein
MDAGPAHAGSHPGEAAGIRVRDVVRAVVAEVAAEELPVVDGLLSFDDDTVVRRLRGRGRRREPLGFGWDEIATLATPVVWLAVDQAAKQLGTAAGKSASRGLTTVLRKVFRRKVAAATVPPLAPAQLADIREQVLTTATTSGLGRKRAEQLADAVYTRLSLNALTDKSRVDKPAGGGAPAQR